MADETHLKHLIKESLKRADPSKVDATENLNSKTKNLN
jgi:hypothetical protein